MELVQELRQAGRQPDAYGAHLAARFTEAADLLEEALKALETARIYVAEDIAERGGIDNCDIAYRHDLEMIDAILTKSQGEKIDG